MNSKLYTINLKTNKADEFINITSVVQEKLSSCSIHDGMIIVFCPHTTAAITINENADPDVVRDMLYGLDKIYPSDDLNYRHFEGNSHAHLKASTLGSNETIIVENGKLLLGTWQGIYFCEFDGPRTRTVYVKIVSF